MSDTIYNEHVFYDYLICPVTNKKIKCFNSGLLKSIGFNNFKEFQRHYPNFPYTCQELKNRRQRLAHSFESTTKKQQKYNAAKRKKEQKYMQNPIRCKHCNAITAYNKIFCNSSCAASYNNKHRILKKQVVHLKIKRKKTIKISKAVRKEICHKKLIKNRNIMQPTILSKRHWRNCICGQYTKLYINTCKISGITWCAPAHKQIHPSVYITKELYRYHASFKFSISQFPLWFDNTTSYIIRKFGWYETKYRKNIDGCSRDHMYSVYDGFTNNILPSIISHPANCQIMPHSLNSKKKAASSITIEELYKRIDDFERLYPNYKHSKLADGVGF